MDRLRTRALALALLGLLLTLPAGAAGPSTTTSDELLKQVQLNVAFVGKAVQQAGVKARDAKARPFLDELRKLSFSLDSLEARAAARNPKAFDDLREAGLSVAALQSTWALSGLQDPGVAAALRKLDSAFAAYRGRFGREAAVTRDGGSLTAPQVQQLARLQQENRKLSERLGQLEGQVAQQPALRSEIRQLRNESSRLSSYQPNPVDFVGALVLAEALAGRWRGLWGWAGVYDPAWVARFQPYANDWLVWNDVTLDVTDVVIWDSSDWTWYDAPVDVTWDVDYTVDLTEQQAAELEQYVEEQMVDTTEIQVEDGATPDMSNPGATDGDDASPDMDQPSSQDQFPQLPGEDPGPVDEAPGGSDPGSGWDDGGGADPGSGGWDEGPSGGGDDGGGWGE